MNVFYAIKYESQYLHSGILKVISQGLDIWCDLSKIIGDKW